MTEFKGDKRTKEYKEWKKKYDAESKGVGDTVEKITEATGIKKAVKFLAGEDCGCDERKEKLNYLFPYRKPECYTEEEYNYLSVIFNRKGDQISGEENERMTAIYNRVFKDNQQPSSCDSCFAKGTYAKLKRIYDEYNE